MSQRDYFVRMCYEIPGQMFPRELMWLYDNLRSSISHAEVGVFCCRSLVASCGGMIGPSKVYAVDVDTPICLALTPGPEWLRTIRDATIKRLETICPRVNVEPMNVGSLAAARELLTRGVKLDSVFIDASHEYEDVSADIQAWRALVKPGGLVAGHDFWPPDPGVMRAVHEQFGESFKVVENCRIWYATN